VNVVNLIRIQTYVTFKCIRFYSETQQCDTSPLQIFTTAFGASKICAGIGWTTRLTMIAPNIRTDPGLIRKYGDFLILVELFQDHVSRVHEKRCEGQLILSL
jgi:hypothetical protein